ncbi:phage portal protein, partial [Pseudomonas syringae]
SNETLETAAMTGEPWQQVIRQRTREVTYRREHNMQPLPKGGLESPPDPNPKEE